MLLAGAALLSLALGLALILGVREPLGAVLFQLAPGLLNMLQAGIQRHVSPALWDSVLLPVLVQPVWVVPAVLGVLFVAIWLIPRRR